MAKKRAPKTDTARETKLDFLTSAMSRWQTSSTHEEPRRVEGEKDLRFLNLQQWDQDDETYRKGAGKPSLVIDQIGEPYRQLLGQISSARPALQINPVDSGADIDTAEVFQGLIRHIEISGGAKAARLQGFKGCIGPGWGYYRVLTDYEYDEPGGEGAGAEVFDQCIRYQAIEDAMTVFVDPATPLHEPWKMRYAFHIEDMPKDEFTRLYPDVLASSAEAFQATGLQMPEWYPEGCVRVADYFYVEETALPEVALLSDGTVLPLSEVPTGAEILQQRTPFRRVVKLAKITGAEILEGNDDKTGGRDWPGSYIPIIPVYGNSLVVNGKRTLRGMVRPARDPQRMYNYQNSELVYELAIAPKSKVIMAEGQMEGHEAMWRDAAQRAYPALFYKPTSVGGERVPAPTVAQFTDPSKIQAIVVAINQHKSDLRSTTGWYDATDPGRKNADQSGRAILARKEAQSEGAVNYKDNFGAALLYEGKVLLDLIPKVYNRPGRILRILGLEDDAQNEEIAYGQPRKPSKAQSRAQRGIQGVFQWGAGRYDVAVSIGTSYTTRRQEAADTQVELMKVLPPPMAAAMAPTAVRNMDIPGASDLADIMQRTLPQEIRGDEDGEPDPQQMQQQMGEMQQALQAMQQKMQEQQQIIQTDAVKANADLRRGQQDNAAKLEIERLKAESAALRVRADLIIKQAELDAEGGKISLQEETKRLLKLADLETSTRIAAQAQAAPPMGGAPA